MAKDTRQQAIESLVAHAEELATTTVELMKLKAVDTSIKVTSGLLTGMIIGILSAICVLFLSIAGAMWIGEALGKMYLGFIIVAGFYVLLTIVGIYFLPKKLERTIGQLIIQKAFQQT
ncbi:MAG: phage holin family protein [Flavobacteriales bacterium]